MDHSVQAYIERMPNRKLKVFLQFCLENRNDYGYIIPDLLEELSKRGE